MGLLSRRFLLGIALLGFCFVNALALPVPSRLPVPGPKAAVPNSGHHPPVPPPAAHGPYAGPPAVAQAHAVRTPPLRKMKVIPPPFRGEDQDDIEPVHPQRPSDTPQEDGKRQKVMGPARSAPVSTGLSFEGIGSGLPGFSPCCTPPDVNGHVGATQYVQWNNLSFAIWDKNGTLLYGPAAGNTLFQPLGGVCASHNDGDPVVNYDLLAGRWILSQLAVYASPGFSHQCVAVSLTSDATGAWYLYDFTTDASNFVDYPHMAVWPDGYYMAAHIFDGSGSFFFAGRIYAFERDKMLNGQPARMLSKDLKQYGGFPQYGFLAADVDSVLPPPPGEAEFVLGPDPASTTLVDSARVAVTWGASPAMALTETQISAGWGIPPCVNNSNGRDCVPQPAPASGSDYLDNLDQHFMHRLAYRNFGGSPVQESLVANITVPGSASTPAHGAIRWFEFRNAGDSTATPVLYQAATFDPDSDYRWMGSIAMDKDHDIALGYSRSSTTTKPSIFVNGRLGSDPLNTLGTETQMMAGAGVQFSPNRWGDYSSMTLDPIDQCTFWYTNEYLRANGSFNWATRIGSFKFPSCTPTSWGNVSGTVTSCANGAPIGGVTVTVGGGYRVISDATGHYSLAVPAGTYSATAAGDDINCSSSSPATVSVIVPADGTVTQDFCMTGASKLEAGNVVVSDTAAGNGNGVVNRNECVDLNVALANNGCARESSISATLTTSTPEVTVTQGSSFYPDLAVGASGTNSVPFKVSTSSNFACGSAISFTLNLTYAGGSKSLTFSVPTCNGGTTTIGPTSIGTGDPTQANRVLRDGTPSDCSGKTCAGPYGADTYNYKTFKFTNSSASTSCVTVTMNGACNGLGEVEAVAYLGSTYTPPTASGSTVCNNYLGDGGRSVGGVLSTVTFSFSVPAHSDFIIVTNTVFGGESCAQFSGTVSGLIDDTPGPGPCPTCTPPAAPAITAAGPTTFCAGGSVVLNSSAAAGNQWYLNGVSIPGATGTSHTATVNGIYTVTTSNNGCVSAPSAGISVTVNPTPATPAASNAGPYCAGSTISLSTPAVANATYAWTGPNGFTSSLQNPTRANATAADAGTYSVVVTVNGCTSAAGATSVTVTPLPATPSPSNSGPFCIGSTIALSTPAVASATYHWTGPNGFTSSLQNPTKTNATAADAGTYFVTVAVNGCTSAGGTTQVVVNTTVPPTPTASNSGPFCAGATISLSTPAVANATYAWTGPNGFTSSLRNPTKTNAAAADAGSYSVTVTVGGCTSAAGTTSVVVNTAIPATPTASNSGPFCAGATISLSTPAVANATYAWTGPNGFTSSQQNPTKTNATAADAGTYSVTVTVGGCTSAAGMTSVAVAPAPAQPAASNGGPYCEGSTITLSTPAVSGATYAWTGPNGFTSALQNPTRANAAAADFGTYAVTITVGGCTSAAGTTTVVDSNAAATATNGGPYCAGDTIALSTPTVSGATYAWTGPNGFTSTLQNPTRANAGAADTGAYSVIVTTADCTSLAGSTNVVVNTSAATPTATNSGPYCEGGTIALFTPTVAGATYAWTGPNGFTSTLQNPAIANATLAAAGTYSVTLFNGCTSSAGTTDVVINTTPSTPSAASSGPFCAGGTISLSTPTVSGATYAWTGPNGFTSSAQNPTRANAGAADAGTYSVTVTVNGCTSAAGTTNVVVTVVGTPSPANGGPYCVGSTIALATPIVPGATYAWTGPNGFTSSLPNPTRVNATAADAGTYSVAVTAGGCTSAAGTTVVAVNPVPAQPVASNGGPYCAGGTISLSTPAVAGATYAWTGPNGFTSSQQNPTKTNVTTADAGTYSVTVTVSGCTSPAGTTNVVVQGAPATPVATNGGPYCAGGTISLSTPAVTGATYAWTGPNGFTSSQQNPTRTNAATADAGTYSVTVTVNGCTSAAGTTSVIVNATPATPTASNTGPYCQGGTISLSTPTVAGATYAWTGPNGFTSNLQNPTRTNASIAHAGTYSVTVTVGGCPSAAGTTNVVVNPTPTVNASNSGPYCAGSTISLFSSFYSGGTYSWTGPNGFTSNLQNPTINNSTVAAAGTYTLTVTANGCPSTPVTTNVVVNAKPATPTASNAGPYCSGGTISLSTPTVAGASYSWTGPSGFFSSAQNPTRPATTANAGTYSVTVSINGCPSSAGTTNVVVNPTPATPVISPAGGVSMCAGFNFVITSSSASGNQWYLDGAPITGATNAAYTATAEGSYTVTASGNGCTSAPSAPFKVNFFPVPDTTITAPAVLDGGGTGAALVPDAGAFAIYTWTITNGTITSGAGTRSITFFSNGSGVITLSAQIVLSYLGCQNPAKTATVTIPPHVVNVAPAAGGISGGTTVSITGGGFQSGASVTFGGTPATNVVYIGPTTITATAPAHAAGSVTVVVTNPDTFAASRDNAFTYAARQFDPNADALVNPGDIFYLVNYLFLSGPPPVGPLGVLSGDANGDGRVDPADIFYAVNYMFLGGPAPASMPASVSTQSAGGALSGSIALGTPVRKGSHYTIPVIVAASPGSAAPQAIALRVTFSSPVRNAAAHADGGIQPLFEINRTTADALAYLITFDGKPAGGVVAEIGLDVAGGENLRIDVDPSVTMLANRAGTRSATAAAGTLQVSGQSLKSSPDVVKSPHPGD